MTKLRPYRGSWVTSFYTADAEERGPGRSGAGDVEDCGSARREGGTGAAEIDVWGSGRGRSGLDPEPAWMETVGAGRGTAGWRAGPAAIRREARSGVSGTSSKPER